MSSSTSPIAISESELKLLQTLIYQECGMFFDDRRAHFLQDRLQRRLRTCNLTSFYDYYRLLTSREGRAEFSALLENLTVNETSFFRNRPATRSLSEVRTGRHAASQAGTSRLESAHLERRLLHRAGAVHAGHDGG
jgi:type IV pilus assembly protein PilK